MYNPFLLHRPNWIETCGQAYHRSEFIHCGWQTDELPVFGRITNILVIAGSRFCTVEKYTTIGLNNHLLSYSIVRTHQVCVLNVSMLRNPQTLFGHTFIGDNQLYIVLRSHFPNFNESCF